ncbi:MAG: hypothetical protein WAM42_08410 [Candidatus Nitrosopolaris sp.]
MVCSQNVDDDDETRRDELSTLTQSFNSMTASIRELMKRGDPNNHSLLCKIVE